MSDWTPEQIAAAAEANYEWRRPPSAPSWADATDDVHVWNRAKARHVLSAVDLSDHDRAVAADALRQAADDLIEAFPQTFRGEDGYLSARMYSSGEYAEWLRARAEAVTDDD